ncbi:MAG: class I SAM-dependent methyltransferase [Patescibacteria group bacterium]
MMFRRTTCRACNSPDLVSVLNLGAQPPANAFLRLEDFAHERAFPLEVFFCRSCTLLQLCDIVSPELLFRDYVYVSSTSPIFQGHFHRYADWLMERYVRNGDLVVDIGSNDGILLKPLKERGAKVLGVDPATGIAQRATGGGIPTLPHFFTQVVAGAIKRRLGEARVITANNMFAHTDATVDVLAGIHELLAPDGVFVVEVAYLGDFLSAGFFDTVYHEHVAYYSVRSLEELVSRAGFHVIDVEHVPTHGGSIRATMSTQRKRQLSVDYFLKNEEAAGLYREATYHAFAERVAQQKRRLVGELTSLKKRGMRIAGYGAPAKGNTLLNYAGINSTMLAYVVDDSPYKQGLYTPGSHIPVVPFEHLLRHRPDYLLLLAWNFADAIMEKCRAALGDGMQYIVPINEHSFHRTTV